MTDRFLPLFLMGTVLSLLTAQLATMYVQAQPVTAATPFEQLAQGQGQQPQQPAATGTPPGTILLTTFPNGTSKAIFANGTVIQTLKLAILSWTQVLQQLHQRPLLLRCPILL